MFEWFQRFRRKNPEVRQQQLTDVTRGLQHAAASTLDMVGEQFIRMLEEYFKPQEDGTLEPRMVRVQLSDTDFIMVPLIALVRPRGLSLDSMRVDLSVKLDPDKTSVQQATGLDASRSSFTVTLAPRDDRQTGERRPTDVVDVTLEFKAREPPEAIMKVIDMFTNLLTPFALLTAEQLARGEKPPRTDYVDSPDYQELLKRYRERMSRATGSAGGAPAEEGKES